MNTENSFGTITCNEAGRLTFSGFVINDPTGLPTQPSEAVIQYAIKKLQACLEEERCWHSNPDNTKGII